MDSLLLTNCKANLRNIPVYLRIYHWGDRWSIYNRTMYINNDYDSIYSASNWFRPTPTKRKTKKFSNICPSWMSWKYLINNWAYVLFIVIYIMLNVVLFAEAAIKYKDNGTTTSNRVLWLLHNDQLQTLSPNVFLFLFAGVFVSIARGCGQCLNFNPVVALVLMLRQCLTVLRSTPLSHFLPLDHHIELHKLTAYFIVAFSITHCLAHLCNFSKLAIQVTPSYLYLGIYVHVTGTQPKDIYYSIS